MILFTLPAALPTHYDRRLSLSATDTVQNKTMIPLLAAIVLAGAAGAGPVLVSDACGTDTTESEHSRCAVEEVERKMNARGRPKELKVESEGKLYSVPDEVEMVHPAPPAKLENWWKELYLRLLCWAGHESGKAKAASSEPSSTNERSPSGVKLASDLRSAGEHSCQICFEHDHSTAMLPCGHGGLCWHCGLQICALTQECPMCRNKIELLVKLDTDTRRCEGEEEFISVVCA